MSKKIINKASLREKTEQDLANELKEHSAKLCKLKLMRSQLEVNQLSQFNVLRRTIAVIKTILSERLRGKN